MKTCERCGEKFKPTQNPEQPYCGKKCHDAAKRRRARDRELLATTCPTPDLTGYPSMEAAGYEYGQRRYLCKCGAVHHETNRSALVGVS